MDTAMGVNPLFGGGGSGAPTPASALAAPGRANPVWSPVQGAEPWQPPASALGMRRIGDVPPVTTVWGTDPAASDTVPSTDDAAEETATVDLEKQLDPEVAGFAAVLHGVMRGEIEPSQALLDYAAVCDRRAWELRSLASAALSRPAARTALLKSAAALRGEASTWRLLWHLHGVRAADFPGGTGGGFVPGAGRAKTLRQRAADLLALDPELNRAARAVAWLEDAAGRDLDRGARHVIAGGGHDDDDDGVGTGLDINGTTAVTDVDAAATFGAGDGVWRETRRRLEAAKLGVPFRTGTGAGLGAGMMSSASSLAPGREGALVTELDPDAPTRQAPRGLDADNTADETRLLRAVWRRLRAGRVASAAELCRKVGQPWRARALLGGGPRGALPVGREAYADDDAGTSAEELARTEEAAAQALAAETEEESAVGGAGARRAAWRAACASAARAQGVSPAEAAVFGVLASDLDAMLPACGTWEDGLWAGLRAWLDAAVDYQLDLGGASGQTAVQDAEDDGDDAIDTDSDATASLEEGSSAAGSRVPDAGDELMDAEDGSGAPAGRRVSGRRIKQAAGRLPATDGQFGEALSLLGLLGSSGSDHDQGVASSPGGKPAPGHGMFSRVLEWPPAELRAAMPATLAEATQSAARAGQAAARAGGEDDDGNGEESTATGEAGDRSLQSVARFRQVQVDLVLDRIDSLVVHRLRDWALQEESAASTGSEGGAGVVAGGGTTAGQSRGTSAQAPAPSPRLLRFAAHLALALWSLGVVGGDNTGAGGCKSETAFGATHDMLHRLLQFYAARLIDGGAGRLVPMYACHLRAGLRRLTLGVQWEGLTMGSVAACRAAYDAALAALTAWEGHGDVVPGEAQAAAAQLVARARAAVVGGPRARAAALRWLAFHADTHGALLRELASLSRELALGGGPGAAAGDYLLNDLVPEALGCDLEAWLQGMRGEGMEDVYHNNVDLSDPSALTSTTASQVLCAEVAMWAAYFELQAAFDDWHAAYAALCAGAKAHDVVAQEALLQRGLPLLHALSLFLVDGCLDLLLSQGLHTMPTMAPWEAVVVVAPQLSGDGDAVDDESEYPTFGDATDVGAAAATLLRMLGASPGPGAERVGWAAGAAPATMPGMVSLAAESTDPAAMQEAAAKLALALKGALKGAGQQPLMVVGMDAPAAFTGAVCHAVCLPQAALRAAALREALAFLGHEGHEGAEVLQLAAFGHPTCFTATEAAELLAFERGATVLQMRRQEEGRASP